ncbi:MAG: arylsulfatase [Sedimentisphaeraceae bacterium JB056]
MNRREMIKATGFSVAAAVLGGCSEELLSFNKKKKPNVVIVITDDQGYGDMGCHGNTKIKTPNIDSLYSESLRLKDYHVGPTCAPTRSSLMTGKYCNTVGVWHTIAGRSILKEGHRTLPQVLSENGYVTGLFGKWHLGDNYPSRPQDRGFDEVLCHGGGGVSQTPDHWKNDYFNDIYLHNGKPERYEGYCTEVWFDGAKKFIEKNHDRPFFAYIATNAPHSPYHVDPKYAEPYRNDPDIPNPEFYGMITNLDENLGRFLKFMDNSGLREDTLFIFMTDNGTAAGYLKGKGYNAGMRGRKGSVYDGGHRVPCFMRYPAENIGGGTDFTDITSHIDIMPTILDFCGLDVEGESVDGISLLPYIKSGKSLPERVLVTDSQRIDMPEKWRASATMTNRWRLVNGEELYDITADPRQMNDVAAENPAVVEWLRGEYEKWWEHVNGDFANYAEIVINSEYEPVTLLTCHDWHPEPCPWNQRQIRQGRAANGKWSVRFAAAGEYEFELRRWPREADAAIDGVVEQGSVEPGVEQWPEAKAFEITGAELCVGQKKLVSEVESGQKCVKFRHKVSAGSNLIGTEFTGNKIEKSLGAYYVYVTKISE